MAYRIACKQGNAERASVASRLTSSSPITSGHPYGKTSLASEMAILAVTPKGARNSQLNVSAFKLFQLVAAGMLSEADVIAGLTHACQRNGLWTDDGPKQCRATIIKRCQGRLSSFHRGRADQLEGTDTAPSNRRF